MTLELRIMGGSEVTMAPQFGNKHGTLSIEPVSTRMVHPEVWEDFKEELAKVWMSYKDYDGTPLNTRVHWAEESPRSIIVGREKNDPIKYWHKIYSDRMKEFFDTLNELTEGVTIEDLNSLFSNEYLDELFKPQWERFGINIDAASSAENNLENGRINEKMETKRIYSSNCCQLQ